MENRDSSVSSDKEEMDVTEESPSSPSSSSSESEKRPRYKNTVHLWEFLLELLADERYSNLIAWSRKEYGEFKLKNQEEVAKRWGILKHRAGMNYEKLSRAIRYYYQQGIIKKVPGQRLVYKFGKLPYEYKPRMKKLRDDEATGNISPSLSPGTFRELEAESSAFLPLTSLTPPPEAGYQFPIMSPLARPPVCSCYDCVVTTCIAQTLHASPVIFPTTSVFTYPPQTVQSRITSIPVSVITSTKS